VLANRYNVLWDHSTPPSPSECDIVARLKDFSMHSPHTLLLLVSLGFASACGNPHNNQIFRPGDIPKGMAGLALGVSHISSSVSQGDRVNVVFTCNGQSTTVIKSARVLKIDPAHRADGQIADVALAISAEEATDYEVALHSQKSCPDSITVSP
jgi:hypothetical protein